MTSVKYYSLHIILSILGIIFCTAVSVCFFFYDSYPLAILFSILLLPLLFILRKQIYFPIRQVTFFLGALNNKDLMIRFPNTRDATLRQMYKDMNQIIAMYWNNQNEIETRKQYYERIMRVMTHEIRNTITPIVSLSANILEHQQDYSTEKTREGLEIIHEQTNNISQFLDSYYQLTHLPQPTYEDVAVKPLLQKLMRLLENETKKATLNFSIAENMTIRADSNLLTLALINLIRNALQAVSEQDNGIIEISASMPNGQPLITISDNGPGIPEKTLETIFLPFYTTNKGGTGVGLSLSRQIIQLHGGNLKVVSQPNMRTTFSILLKTPIQ